MVKASPLPTTTDILSHKNHWSTFRSALDESVKSIKQEYFRVPRFEQDAAWRERAYCYELYHQLRSRLPLGFPYTLHGEIDKAGHEAITRHFGKGSRPNPDFIVHMPGNHSPGANLALIEVKASKSRTDDIQEDVRKISIFMSEIRYQHGIILFFGDERPDPLPNLGQLEALWHKRVGAVPVVGNYGSFD